MHRALSYLTQASISIAAFIAGMLTSHLGISPRIDDHPKIAIARTVVAKPPAKPRRRTAPKPAYLSPEQLDALIATTADYAGLSPRLLRAVLMNESGGNINAVSKAHAKGLMQLESSTGEMYGAKGVFEVHRNITIGADYLASLIEKYNNTALALAAYNAGPQIVDRYRGIPPYPETIAYVKGILGDDALKHYKADAQGALMPPDPHQAAESNARRLQR